MDFIIYSLLADVSVLFAAVCIRSIYILMFCSSTVSGTEPWANIAAWNSRKSKSSPNICVARARSSLILISPSLYDSAWPGHEI